MKTTQSALRVYGRLARLLIAAIPSVLLASNLAFGQSVRPGPNTFIHPSGGRAPSQRSAGPGLQAILAEDPPVPTFHSSDQLVCPQCHTMHASQQHEYSATAPADPFGPTPRTFTPTAYLLKAADPVLLCVTCHDGQANIPDVIKEDTNGLAERSAGFFDAVDTDNYKGHKLKTGLSVGGRLNNFCVRCHFGGTFAEAGVTCIDCHNPHGNGRVRNLQWASYPGGEPPFGLFMANSALGNMARYEAANIGYGTDNTSNLREVTNMCIDCHHVFSGGAYIDSDSDGIHERHPTYESERSSINSIAQGQSRGTTDPNHWQNGTGSGFTDSARVRFVTNGALNFADSKVIDATKNGVFCLSCHKAHGSDHAFSLTWNATGATTFDGCEQCHNKQSQ